MGIKSKSSVAGIDAEFRKRANAYHNAIVQLLHRLGELCLIECRTNRTYQDQTGNLTASMGYVVVANGKIVYTGGFGQLDGGSTGESLAREIASGINSSYALVVVAGMNYAYYVESKGYNVLSSAELLAERKLPELLRQLKKNIKNMN